MKKIFGRLFKWKSKSDRPTAEPPVAAHEIALKHAAIRQRAQSAEEKTSAAMEADAPEILDGAVAPRKRRASKILVGAAAPGKGRVRKIQDGATAPGKERANKIQDSVEALRARRANKVQDGAATPRKGRVNKKKRRTVRVGSAADDFLMGGRKRIKPGTEEPARSVALSASSGMDARQTRKARSRKNSSFL